MSQDGQKSAEQLNALFARARGEYDARAINAGISAKKEAQDKRRLFNSDEDASSFEFILYLTALCLAFIGLSLLVIELSFDPKFTFSTEIAAFGFFALFPLGLLLAAFAYFIYPNYRKRKIANFVDTKKSDPVFSDSIARLFSPNDHPLPKTIQYISSKVPVGYIPQFIDNNKKLLKYPTLLKTTGKLPTNTLFPFDKTRSDAWRSNRKKGILYQIAGLLCAVFTWSYFLVYYDDVALGNTVIPVIVFLIIAASSFFIYGQKYPKRLDEKLYSARNVIPEQASFFSSLSHAVIDLQGGTKAQSIDAMRIAPPEKRTEVINCLFDRETGVPTIRIQQKFAYYRIEFNISRGLRLMSPLDSTILRAIFHCYNLEFLSDEGYRYLVASILFGQKQGEISDFKESGKLLGVNLMPLNENMNEKDRAYYVIEKELELDCAHALDLALQFIDKLKRDYPDDPDIKKIHQDIHSGHNMLSPTDIPGTIFDANVKDDHSLYFGMMDDDKTPLCFNSNESVIAIAPPGSGKTQAFVLQNLLRWKGSAVILDVKGELYEKTAGYRARFSKVYKLNIFEDQTDAFNPFDLLPSDISQLWEEALFMAEMMVVPLSSGDSFWDNAAQDILRFAIAAMVLDDDNEERSIEYILDVIACRENLEKAEYVLESTGHRPAVRAAARLNELTKREEGGGSNMLSSILQTLATGLRNLEGDRITKATARSDWTPDDLRNEPITIYIVLKPGAGQQYAPLIRLILGQHLRVLTPQNPPPNPEPILFMLDEMPDLGHMRPIEKALDMGRGYGLRLWMFAQDTSQIERCYQNSGAFIGKCAVQVYMDCSLSDGTAEAVSRAIGTKKSLADGRQELAVRPEELASEQYADKAIVFGRGTRPAVVTRAMAWKNPDLVKVMKIPPPK